MSGTALGIAGAAFSAAQLLGLDACKLGSVTFQQFEVPDEMPWGGTQRVARHEMPGGARVLDAMGAYDLDYSWSGRFYGSAAVARARQVDAIRQAGQPVTLSWGSFTFSVIVSEFRCRYTMIGAWLPYTVTCISIPQTPAAPTPTMLGQLTADVTSALGISDLINSADTYLTQAQSALTTVQSALPVVGALTAGSSAFVAVSSAVATATGVISTAAGVVGNTITNFGTAALASGTAPIVAAATVNSMAAATGEAAGLSAQGDYLGRMNSNLIITGG